MKFVLSQIRKEAQNKLVSFDQQVDISELKSLNNDIREAKEVQVFGSYALDGEEVIFSLNIVGEVILPCSRTLVDVPYSFHVKVTEIFSTSLAYGQEEEQEDIHYLDGEVIDLYPYILENILLELPYRVVTEDKSVLDNALFEGEGWSFALEEEYEQREKQIDPRLKKLEQLLRKDEEN